MSKTRPKHFPGYTLVTDTEMDRTLESAGSGPIDHGSDTLPFEHLGGRRFEIMAYLAKIDQHSGSSEFSVTLVQSSADRGRDVIVYNNSVLTEIVQCKNQISKLSGPELIRELLKLALHNHMDSTILGTGPISYEIWCSSDFSEPASQLIDLWPSGWEETSVKSQFQAVIAEYSQLKGLKYDDLKDYLFNDFPKIVKPKKLTGIDISAEVRARTKVYERFFQGIIVMRKDDVDDFLENKLSQGGLRQITDEDLKHIVDRIEKISPDKRLYLGLAYSIGISPKTISLFTSEETSQFIVNCANPVFLNSTMIMKALLRYVDRGIASKVSSMIHGSPAYQYTLRKVMRTRIASTIGRIAVPTMLQSQLMPDHYNASLDTLTDKMCAATWNELNEARNRYNPTLHAPDSTQRVLARFAEVSLLGTDSKEAFEQVLRQDFERNKLQIMKWDEELHELIPQEMIIISDSKVCLEERALMERTIKTAQIIDDARKKNIGSDNENATLASPQPSLAPQLDQVTWSKLPYRQGSLHRGYYAGLIFRGSNFSQNVKWTMRKIDNPDMLLLSGEQRWSDANIYTPNYFEVSTNDDELTVPINYSDCEFQIKNADGQLSEWRNFYYPMDREVLLTQLVSLETLGRTLYTGNQHEDAIEPLRKASLIYAYLNKIADFTTTELFKIYKMCADKVFSLRNRSQTPPESPAQDTEPSVSSVPEPPAKDARLPTQDAEPPVSSVPEAPVKDAEPPVSSVPESPVKDTEPSVSSVPESPTKETQSPVSSAPESPAQDAEPPVSSTPESSVKDTEPSVSVEPESSVKDTEPPAPGR